MDSFRRINWSVHTSLCDSTPTLGLSSYVRYAFLRLSFIPIVNVDNLYEHESFSKTMSAYVLSIVLTSVGIGRISTTSTFIHLCGEFGVDWSDWLLSDDCSWTWRLFSVDLHVERLGIVSDNVIEYNQCQNWMNDFPIGIIRHVYIITHSVYKLQTVTSLR